ncbi:hypothetical protein TWF694_005214 [Orbilia ellipsospora]|uniref:MACPF domain-containing protein n=1 Tax=Orbilia ellipsospora TaxID=2528407 RepID=A0AAV9WUX1_9PEZI
MDIQDVFPENPLMLSVKYLGTNQTPFTVPWAKGRVQLCTGFNTGRELDDDLFVNRTAFQDIEETILRYRECQITSIKDESGSSIATSSENSSFCISASVGSSFLGASGRGSYEKSIRDTRNTSSISVTANHSSGQIEFIQMPQLNLDAVRLLTTSNDPINKFRQMYGDFYVAGYRVGAVNGTTVSGELANKSFFEAKRAEIDLVAISKSIDEASASTSDSGGLCVAAFDSLTGFHSSFIARTYQDSIEAGNVISANKERAMTIAARAADVLEEVFMGRDQSACACISQDAVGQLWDRGLVTGLMLAPFTTLREYQSVLLRRSRTD